MQAYIYLGMDTQNYIYIFINIFVYFQFFLFVYIYISLLVFFMLKTFFIQFRLFQHLHSHWNTIFPNKSPQEMIFLGTCKFLNFKFLCTILFSVETANCKLPHRKLSFTKPLRKLYASVSKNYPVDYDQLSSCYCVRILSYGLLVLTNQGLTRLLMKPG